MSHPVRTVDVMNTAWLTRRFARLPMWGWGLIALVLIAAFAGGGSTNSDSESSPTSSVTATTVRSTTTTTQRVTTTTRPRPTTTTTTLPVINSGTFIVGTEIQPGPYRVAGYWARLDASFDIIRNDGVYEDRALSYVEIQATDAYFELRGEAIAIGDFPVYDPVALGVEEGTYLVGIDIQPG